MAKSLPPAGHYNANYGNFQSELYAQIRHEAFGEDIGQNSWLTSDEQDSFLQWLDLSPKKMRAQFDIKAVRKMCRNVNHHEQEAHRFFH